MVAFKGPLLLDKSEALPRKVYRREERVWGVSTAFCLEVKRKALSVSFGGSFASAQEACLVMETTSLLVGKVSLLE